MSLILNIETSSTNCSVSISEYDEIIASQEKDFEHYSHSKVLHVYILFGLSGRGVTYLGSLSNSIINLV